MMTFLRRVSSAITLAAATAAVFRVQGRRTTTPVRGGWQPHQLPPIDEPLPPLRTVDTVGSVTAAR